MSEPAGSVAPPPVGIDRERHLVRAHHAPWPRRVWLLSLATMCGLGVANVFGSTPTQSSASSSAATLTVKSPDRLRGGLIFTTEITVAARADVHDAQITLSSGWWRDMTLNAVAPQANSETSDASGLTFDYGEVKPGDELQVWISWQTNPGTIGVRDQNVQLLDGSQPLLSVARSFTVFF